MGRYANQEGFAFFLVSIKEALPLSFEAVDREIVYMGPGPIGPCMGL